MKGLTLGGKMNFYNYGVVTQSGQATVGDASGPGAAITNKAGATWNLTAAVGFSGGGTFNNSGLLEKTGAGVSLIVAAIANNGTITAAKGTLDLTGAVTGTGVMNTTSGSTLELGGKVSAGQKTVFGVGGGVVELNQRRQFLRQRQRLRRRGQDRLADTFTAGETIGFVENVGGTQGVLTVTSGAQKAKINLFGQYAAANFKMTADATGGTAITFLASAVSSVQAALVRPVH